MRAGSEEPRRNVSTILQAFKNVLLEYPDALLVRVGSRWDTITKMIESMNLNENIVRPGKVSEKLLPLYYSAADVYVCLDKDTGFGLPPLEAMSCGVPVVCSREGAFPEVVGNTGFLINPMDKKAAADSLKMILSDNKLRSRLSKRAFNRAKTFNSCGDEKRCVNKVFLFH